MHKSNSCYLTFIAILCLPFLSKSQQIGVSGGYLINHYFGFNSERYHNTPEYENGSGFSFAISCDRIYFDPRDIKNNPNASPDSVRLRFHLGYSQYDGGVHCSDGSPAGSTSTQIYSIRKNIVVGIYPVNFYIAKNIDFNLGAEFNILVDSEITGWQSGWSIVNGGSGFVHYFPNDSIDLESTFNWGLSGRLAYNLEVAEKWFIIPEYTFYLGVGSEFKDIEAATNSMRHAFSLGIGKRF